MSGLLRFLFVLLIAIQPALAGDNIEITNAWINEAPPVAKVLAAYLTVENSTNEPLSLTAARSPAFERIEFHLTRVKDGVAGMQKQEEIVIPAQSGFSFSPGSYHLMLFHPLQTIKAGDKIPLQLEFSNNMTIGIEAEVRRGDPGTHHHH